MKNPLAKRLLIAVILLILPLGIIAEGKVFAIKIDTKPVTLTPEENSKTTLAVEKATPIEVKTQKVATTQTLSLIHI